MKLLELVNKYAELKVVEATSQYRPVRVDSLTMSLSHSIRYLNDAEEVYDEILKHEDNRIAVLEKIEEKADKNARFTAFSCLAKEALRDGNA